MLYKYVLRFVIGVMVVLCFIVVSIVVAQNAGSLHITQLLRNDADTSIVAFTVYGTFLGNDVVNVYSNGLFIKAKPINTPDLIGQREITIGNISVDVFVRGANEIVAKIEREGVEVVTSDSFNLVIQEPPGKPKITVLENRDQGVLAVDVVGDFEVNDVVKIFLNGFEFRTKAVVSDDVSSGRTRVSDIPIADLQVGENYFESSIMREGYEGDRSDRFSFTAVAEEGLPEQVESGDEVVVSEEEESEDDEVVQCVGYGEPQQVVAPDGKVYDGFGGAVDVKSNLFVVGTRLAGAYIHQKGSEGWLYPSKVFERGDGARGSSNKSVAVYDNSTVLVGSPNAWHGHQSSGVVYIYKRYGEVWTKYATLSSQQPESFELFGSQVALDGTMLAVSAERQNRSGAVYVYTRTGATWAPQTTIIPRNSKANQRFGHSISVNGDRLAVGVPGDGEGGSGAVYVYTRSGNEFAAEVVAQRYRRSGAQFGKQVYLRGNMLLVSAALDDGQQGSTSSGGVVYVYMLQDDGWYLAQTLRARDDDKRANFGAALALSDDGRLLAVGATESDVARDRSGAVYIFERSRARSVLWEMKEVVAPEQIARNDRFGSSIDFEGLDMFVGAYGTDTGKRNAGAVYVYNVAMIPCGEVSEDEQQEEVMIPVSGVEQTLEERKDFLGSLREEKELVDQVLQKVQDLAALLGRSIEDVYSSVVKEEESIVIYDESLVHEQAQKRAAEKRGIVAPGLPGEVVVLRLESPDDIPEVPTEETVRLRGAVIAETEGQLGAVVPVTAKDLRLGDVHEEVYRLQVFLNKNGYTVAKTGPGSSGSETSTFTEETDRALRSFQLVNGLPVTGILDKKTRDVIITFIGNTR